MRKEGSAVFAFPAKETPRLKAGFPWADSE